MKEIEKLYDYIFYTFYRFWEKAIWRWCSEWKAAITMVFIWIILISTINNIQLYLFKSTSISDYPIFSLFLSSAISVIHYYIYLYDDKWKNRVLKFRSINKKKDTYGIIIIIFLAIIILSFARYSSHLLSTLDWKNISHCSALRQ